ncbi:copper resistance CopC/CopD family protein [Devosia beringensis]|uniref:copper resistance CopC/CopD family protein n=1 Tax=Devosia beringensis TaxID=2657486 RepID=UPI00186B7791|nr:copper resistance protein CopC [Devosia beringensis]
MPSMTKRLCELLLAVLLSLAATHAAFAHAQLLSTSPQENAVVTSSQTQLELVFNEPVSALAISLIKPDGGALDLLDQTSSGQTMTVLLPTGLADGTHVLSWRAVSVDSHPVAGSLVFSIGAAGGAAIAELPTSSLATELALWAAKGLLFVALLFGAGGAIFALAAPLPRQGRQLAMILSGLGLVVAPLSLGLQGLDALGLAPDALARTRPWLAGYLTSYGGTVIAILVALALGWMTLLLPALRAAGWLVWALAAMALALSGHAGAAEPQWLTRSAVTLHLAGILFWVGALLPLWFWLGQHDDNADRALAQFSRFIPFAVASIIVSGVTLAVIQLGAPGPAWLTPYGLILAAKLALLAVLFTLALINRIRLTAPALAGQVAARQRLRQSIAVEIGIVLLILALVAGWRFTPPPRALAQVVQAAVSSAPLYAHAMDNVAMADITIVPGHVGPVVMDLFLTDMAGAALEPLGVTVTLSSRSLGIEPIVTDARLVDGAWRIDPLTIPVAGTWLVDIDLRLSRFSLSRLQTEIDIPSP